MVRNKRIVITAVVIFSLFLLTSCYGSARPANKTNFMPYGTYTGEAGTLTFQVDSHDGWSDDRGYVGIQLAPDYIYLLGGQENNIMYYTFQLDNRDNDSDLSHWHICGYSKEENWEDRQEIFLFDFVWNRAGWNMGEDEVIIQGADGNLIFRFNKDN